MPKPAIMFLVLGMTAAFVMTSNAEPKSVGTVVSGALAKMCVQQWESCWKGCNGGRLCVTHCEMQYQSCLRPKRLQPK